MVIYQSGMLPSVYQQPYQQLQQNVKELQNALGSTLDSPTLKTAIATLQSFFQTQIWNLDMQDIAPDLEQQARSINVEIDKQLRLLNMDAMFLQAARQEATKQQRQQQIHDRLFLLTQYCNSILETK